MLYYIYMLLKRTTDTRVVAGPELEVCKPDKP